MNLPSHYRTKVINSPSMFFQLVISTCINMVEIRDRLTSNGCEIRRDVNDRASLTPEHIGPKVLGCKKWAQLSLFCSFKTTKD